MKKYKLSTDSTIQMALQLAYNKLHGEGVPTYESGHTRQFKNGRTETCRSFSETSKQFTEIMLNSESSNQAKMGAFLRAVENHKQYMIDVINGKGCDRALMGYKILAFEGNFN